MLLHLLVDFKKDNWSFVEKDLFNDLMVFLNTYRLSNLDNRIQIIQDLCAVWDSAEDSLLDIANIQNTFQVNDLGYILTKTKYEEVRILVFTLHKVDTQDYLKFLTCMYTAQRRGIRVDVFSLVPNPILKQCAAVTQGKYSDDEEDCLRFLLSTLGILKFPSLTEYLVRCYCHNKTLSLGLTCPICLAVYCKFVPVCKRCKSKFNFKKIK
ncbi:General transcription factor IIH subunit 3 [Nosema granulosis]|uniref:General transcription and DNA repair factor IIH subunit TFB4 n=1 Tax=Nosema granulosis TaxID=83296 RepID=A0A9P6KYV9_9MICR|nr:General transcription factor IIH subunit 3 [Nosema granulosis]